MKRKVLFIVIALCLFSIGAFFYHHYTDYDIAAVLRNTHLPFPSQKMETISSLSQIHHVFIIVEENHDWQTIYKNPSAPYINERLIAQGAFAKDYHNVAKNLHDLHPSEPNYIMLESGSIAFTDHTFTTDNPPSQQNSTHSLNHLTSLLDKNGYSWKSYQEDISGNDCPIYAIQSYVSKHNPFIFFQDVSGNPPDSSNRYCKEHIRPLTELQKDLNANTVAHYVFITPNLQHDMHDGTVAQADMWLSQIVPVITNTSSFKKDGALFITWDEGSETTEGNNPIGLLIESPFIKKQYANTIAYSHASLVKTIEAIFHLSPLLGFANDRQTRDLSDFFITNQ